MMAPTPAALTIAGSDSGGGAGIQADLKTFARFGVFGSTAVTALTAQNTGGVRDILAARPDFVAAQIHAVMADLAPGAAKTGMLADAGIVAAVADALADYPDLALVVDPVMVATTGDRLLSIDAVAGIRDRLVPYAALVTPNLPEARLLTGLDEAADGPELCDALLGLGARAVLVKGGHGEAETVSDWLATPEGTRVLSHPRRPGRYHGTGCCLSAGITAGLARGHDLEASIRAAGEWLQALMAAARPGHCNAARILPFETVGR